MDDHETYPTFTLHEAWITKAIRSRLGDRPGLLIEAMRDGDVYWIMLWVGTFSAEAIVPVATLQRMRDRDAFLGWMAEKLVARAPVEADIDCWN